MNDNEQRTAIAEACGWKYCGTFIGQDKTNAGVPKGWEPNAPRAGDVTTLPDYLNDLNAMQSADPEGRSAKALCKILGITSWTSSVLTTQMVLKSTARQRAEAFLKTICQWKN